MEKVSGKKIWSQYAAAMATRRPDSVLEYGRFIAYLRRTGTVIIGRSGSFIIGQSESGVFVPTHFAPLGPKSAVELLRGLPRRRRVAWAVTPDLVPMLVRLGYKVIPFSRHFVEWHGKEEVKYFLVDRWSTLAFIGFGNFRSVVLKAAEAVKLTAHRAVINLRGLIQAMVSKEDDPIDVDELYRRIYGED
jgi:hypothetical protein